MLQLDDDYATRVKNSEKVSWKLDDAAMDQVSPDGKRRIAGRSASLRRAA